LDYFVCANFADFQVIRGGSFGIFTIAEHITFALQALPIAFPLSIAIVGLMAEHHRVPRRVVRIDMPHIWRKWLARGLLALMLIAIILLGVFAYHARSATLLLLFAIVGGFIFVLLPAPELIRNRTVGAIFGLTIGFGMAFGFGIDAARFELWIELPLNKITIGSNALPGREAL
jgi:hypothetical protein